MRRLTEIVYQIPIFLQERTVVSFFRNILGTSEIDVNSITVWFYNPGRIEQLRGVVCAKLNNQWTVSNSAFFTALDIKILIPVPFFCGVCEHLGKMVRSLSYDVVTNLCIDHWGIRKLNKRVRINKELLVITYLSAIFSGHSPPGLTRCVRRI